MIRPATPADIPAIYQLVRDLASYEKALANVTGSEAELRQALLAEPPAVFAHVAEHDGQVGGFALWYLSFSTWTASHGIYLEDLYVRPELAGSAWAGRCWPGWPGSASPAATRGWSGPCSTGTPRPAASTPRWARPRCPNGSSTGCPARPCATWPLLSELS